MSCTYCSRNDKGNFPAIKNELKASDASSEKTQSPAGWARETRRRKVFRKQILTFCTVQLHPKKSHMLKYFFVETKNIPRPLLLQPFFGFRVDATYGILKVAFESVACAGSAVCQRPTPMAFHFTSLLHAPTRKNVWKKVKSGTKMLLIHTVECLQTENTKGFM